MKTFTSIPDVFMNPVKVSEIKNLAEKRCMKGKMFLDSNILVYSSLQDDKEKHDIVLNLWRQLEGNFIFVSTQVVNEVYVSLLKHALTDKDIQNIVLKIIDVCNVSVITIDSIKSAWKLKKQYNLSYWDSLV